MPRKKTIAFSTKANSNTKENIANVYGTKTLLALIPLDLKFEMNPTNRPGATQGARNWSTQDDPGSRTVHIVGHMSRPVVGEGRQTPDRQMFFVNSRPCTLPQVAKAFNEVYKSYNITQSPFVFADIKLDTEAYDVNVSPDKRTIMLHDQTALLESLKEALVELFQSHEQSVPQAQPLGKRAPSIPAFKPPVLQQHESAVSAGEDCTEPDQTRKLSSTLVENSGSSFSSEAPTRPGFIKASLIERFAGRDVEERSVLSRTRKRKSTSPENGEITEVRISPLIVRQRNPSSGTTIHQLQSGSRSTSPLFESEQEAPIVSPPVDHPSKAVQDFNARVASQHTKQVDLGPSPGSVDLEKEAEEAEERIPSIEQTPQKRLSQSTLQNAFDRMRPMRTPVEQATITIGDTTTVSTIGSSSHSRSSKRARIHIPRFGLDGKPLNQTTNKPLLMKSLRGFAAPGTQVGESESEDEGEESPDNSMPDIPARSPSPHKRRSTKEFDEPRTDDIDMSSGVLIPSELAVDLDLLEPEERAPQPRTRDVASDDEYIDDSEKKVREEARIARMIANAEEAAARPTELNLKRAGKLFKISHKKYLTLNLERVIDTNTTLISSNVRSLAAALEDVVQVERISNLLSSPQLNKEDPEERLSLTVAKSDFGNMRIIGQFNLGFILAVRPPTPTSPTPDLFIIDQHASDEKYNFERLSATTILVSQRLVHPHPLELTAVEEEIILANEHTLSANGFVVEMDTSGSISVGRRARLTSLPMSKEVTFTPTDLEELVALVMDNPSAPSSSIPTSTYIPRPSKVRKLLASRACRSSVMIGKTLKASTMENIVRHMGTMDKPWSCPHGRPTMRHLYGLDSWEAWSEGDGVVGLGEVGLQTNWSAYLKRMKG
jgi:DNA mismatch repair protein PMS2